MQGSMPQTVITGYVRLKIYSDHGSEEYSTVDLTTTERKARISDVKGRTIKPDGTIVDLEKASVFERTVVKAGDRRVRTQSFSLPNVAAGDIIEYQWREFYDDSWSNYLRLYFQRETPTWLIRYHVKPNVQASEIGYRMSSQSFNCNNTPFEAEPQGFFETHVENVPALEAEPYMPPEDQIRSWVLLFYSRKRHLDQEKFWNEHGKEKYKEYSGNIQVDGDVKEKATELIAGLSTDDEKIERIRQYCVNDIRNVYYDRYGVTAEEREKLEEHRKPSDTIKIGMGTGSDVNFLFAALLQAAGLNARMALVGGRDDRLFNPGFLNPYFLNRANVAVQVGESWRFYDPASPYVPSGMLSWREEDVPALITDNKEPKFVQTPLSGPDRTSVTRVGKFTLDSEGTLEGDVIAQFKGHFGVSRKLQYEGLTPDERESDLTEKLQDLSPGAEISDIRIGNADTLDGPFSYRYKIRYPGYAARTGKRLFLQPEYFKKNVAARFPNAERKNDVYFDYPWSEHDRVEIVLPEGFALEEAESPLSTTIAKVGDYQVRLGTTADGKTLIYTREFSFGQDGSYYFPVTAYETIKRVFDFIHEQDGHTVTLREQDRISGAEQL